jgi:hypothetical protein
MKIFLSNGITTVPVELLGPSGSSSQWVQSTRRIADYLTPTANMQFIVNVGDPGPVFNIVEGGLDKFEVVEITGMADNTASSDVTIQAFPNPFTDQITLVMQRNEGALMEITDISGRLVERFNTGTSNMITVGKNWEKGIYLARIIDSAGAGKVCKLIKR